MDGARKAEMSAVLRAVSEVPKKQSAEPVLAPSLRLLNDGALGPVSARLIDPAPLAEATASATQPSDQPDATAAVDEEPRRPPAPPPLCSTIPLHGLPPNSLFDSDDLMRNDLLERYLLNPPLGDPPCVQDRIWPREVDPLTIVSVDFPTAPPTDILVRSDLETGQPLEFYEGPAAAGLNGANSTGMERGVAFAADFVRGSSTSTPFRPGGLDPDAPPPPPVGVDSTGGDNAVEMGAEGSGEGVDLGHEADGVVELDFESNLLVIPPGLSRGCMFDVSQRRAGVGAAAVLEGMLPREGAELEVARVATGSSSSAAADPLPRTTAGTMQGQEEEEGVTADVDAALEVKDDVRREVSASVAEHKVWGLVDDGTAEDFHTEVPTMARSYPFELDRFQKLAVMHLERNESVFVAAHTSAGKTVVAEYAIALTAQHMTRCIYTSPIKALSNQKFRDFDEGGVDVGLLTGDIQLRPEANCLIMTTEILRSMLYRGADVIRDVEWVIFDEVHYVNDADRGVVWEEVIIMLPAHVNIVMLSATVPNTFEFADWVGRTKKKPIYVISTLQRPVPLEHFLFIGSEAGVSKKAAATDSLFKLVNSKSELLMDGYRRAMRIKNARESDRDKNFGPKGRQQGRGGNEKGLYVSLVSMLERMELQPCVIFTFSKKRCESNADALSSLDLMTAKQKSEIHVFIQASVNRLSGSDRRLPQVLRLAEMLKRGIGVHHGGLLPILKEMVEILFGRGLVKVLFATETFAMGVNMPARCVVFDTIRKHDGTQFRDLLAGEYVQMAGRAGRRGLDKTGTVIILVKGDLPEISDLQKMMLGKPTQLASKFRLTYNMILNLLRVEELRVEDMIKRSFAENFGQRDVRENREALESTEAQLDQMGTAGECHRCIDVAEFYEASKAVLSLTHVIQNGVASHGLKYLGVGRVVVLNSAIHRNTLAVILRAEPSAAVAASAQTGMAATKRFSVLVLVEAGSPQDPAASGKGGEGSRSGSKREQGGEQGELGGSAADVPVPITTLNLPERNGIGVIAIVSAADMMVVSKHRLKVSVLETLDRPVPEVQADVAQQLLRIGEASATGLEPLDPLRDMRINNIEVADAWSQLQATRAKLGTFQCAKCPTFAECYRRHHRKVQLASLKETLQFRLSDDSLQLLPEYKQRVEVLKIMRYIDEGCAVQLKGRVACEISTCDELIVSELLFENSLSDLEPAEIVALLSCMVFQEKVEVEPTLSDSLQRGVDEIKRVARGIAETQQACGMDTPVDEYVRGLKFGLVEAVHAWASGVPFAEITELTDVLEGSIVRCIVRLDETCRDVRNAARVIGDPVLYQKMVDGSDLIKRDIVFAASLYTQ
eukprot:m.155667 g.155667  ORF g.155667 m.155667 type:complete len:1346 (+) comp14415_c0_seq3:153-4190(+)